MARERGRGQVVPAYVVFTDATLEVAIAERLPSDLGRLAGVPGVGARKLEQYGPALLALVADRPVPVEPS